MIASACLVTFRHHRNEWPCVHLMRPGQPEWTRCGLSVLKLKKDWKVDVDRELTCQRCINCTGKDEFDGNAFLTVDKAAHTLKIHYLRPGENLECHDCGILLGPGDFHGRDCPVCGATFETALRIQVRSMRP